MSPKKAYTMQFDPAVMAQVDQAAEASGISRQTWMANAAISQLGNTASGTSFVVTSNTTTVTAAAALEPDPAYRQHVPGPDVTNIRSSSQAKADVKPIPKQAESRRSR